MPLEENLPVPQFAEVQGLLLAHSKQGRPSVAHTLPAVPPEAKSSVRIFAGVLDLLAPGLLQSQRRYMMMMIVLACRGIEAAFADLYYFCFLLFFSPWVIKTAYGYILE